MKTPRDNRKMKLTHAIQKFLLDCTSRGLSAKTTRRYHDDLHRLTHHMNNPNKLLRSITSDELKILFVKLHERKLSPFSIEGIHRSLNCFFNFCEREQFIASNPMRHMKKPKLPHQIIPRLDEGQIKQLFSAIRYTNDAQRNQAIVMFMIDSGLRRGEITKLMMLDVHRRFVKVKGKGRREREVPISRETQSAIKKWITIRPASNDNHLFITHTGKPLTDSAIASLFRRLKKTLNLKRFYPHLLRHTFAKAYLRKGDAKSLSLILGHQKVSTTLEIYVDYDLQDLIRKHHVAHPIKF